MSVFGQYFRKKWSVFGFNFDFFVLTAVVNTGDEETHDDVITTPRPQTSSSVGRKIEEIFETSTKDGNGSTSAFTTYRSNVSDGDEDEVYDAGVTQSRTTFDDLLNTIRLLENEPSEVATATNNNNNNNKTMVTESREGGNKMAELWSNNNDDNNNDDNVPHEAILSLDNLTKLQVPDVVPTASSYLTADKLQNILTFLDDVEKVEEDVRTEVLRESKDLASEVDILLEKAESEVHQSICVGGGGGWKLCLLVLSGRNCRGGGVNFRNSDFLPSISIDYNPPNLRNLKNNFETLGNVFPYFYNSFKFMQILGKFELLRQTFPPTPIYYDPLNL